MYRLRGACIKAMSQTELDKLIESIQENEGYREEVYLDHLGNLTCGWGHRLAVGTKMPQEACRILFRMDIADAVNGFNRIELTKVRSLNIARRMVIVEMIFNMGLSAVKQFYRMWDAIQQKDWDRASQEMLDSQWHKQVGRRAERLAEIMKKGECV